MSAPLMPWERPASDVAVLAALFELADYAKKCRRVFPTRDDLAGRKLAKWFQLRYGDDPALQVGVLRSVYPEAKISFWRPEKGFGGSYTWPGGWTWYPEGEVFLKVLEFGSGPDA